MKMALNVAEKESIVIIIAIKPWMAHLMQGKESGSVTMEQR